MVKRTGAKFHVVIVGAGIIGATIAFYLSRRGIEVTVLDSTQVPSGATSHSFAWLNAFAKTEPESHFQLNWKSMDMWDRFVRLLGEDVGLRWGGGLTWESTGEGAKRLIERIRILQERGYPARLITNKELLDLEPELSPGNVTAAAYQETEGQVDPVDVVRACLIRVASGGWTINLGHPVSKLISSGTRIHAVQTAEDVIPCDAVVMAAGVDATQLVKPLGVDLPQQISPGVTFTTNVQKPLIKTASVIYSPTFDGDESTHFRQRADGSFMIGEGKQESLAEDDSQDHANRVLGRAIQYIPALSGAIAIPIPVKLRPMPLDGLPIIGFTKSVPNLYIAVMHSGVTLAPLVGEWAAIEIADGTIISDLEKYRVERFSEG